MPNLSHKSALNFWKDYKDPTIYRIVTFMESLEDWTIDDDNDELNKALQSLGNALEDIDKIDLSKKEDIIKASAFIKISRLLYILQTMDTAQPGTASKILTHAENTTQSKDDMANLFLQRNVIFERLRLIYRIFSKERLALIQQVLEDENVE